MENPYKGTEFDKIKAALVLLRRLQEANLDVDLVWLVPPDVFAGGTELYGIKVIRTADVPGPMLAHYVLERDSAAR